ncbi:MAG TPA: hypothetical protein VHP11_00080 [Tepidisphaeraceae bacterium]|nr:hypothetical protein [Tepidisphaeraceae bacterium]
MTTEMQEIPTAQYYTTTDRTLAKLIQLIAILSIVIGGAGLLEMGMALGSHLLDNSQIAPSFQKTPALITVTTLTNWLLFSPLKLFSGIGCLYRKEWARRGMVAVAILTIIYSGVFDCLYSYYCISRGISPSFISGASRFHQATFMLRMTSGFAAGLLLPLLMLILFRSEGVKQLFKQET